jgi:hypothetical protein
LLVPALVSVAFVTIAERKTMASMQRRLGPNSVGSKKWNFSFRKFYHNSRQLPVKSGSNFVRGDKYIIKLRGKLPRVVCRINNNNVNMWVFGGDPDRGLRQKRASLERSSIIRKFYCSLSSPAFTALPPGGIPLSPEWITGFVDGEGLVRSSNYKIVIVSPRMNCASLISN